MHLLSLADEMLMEVALWVLEVADVASLVGLLVTCKHLHRFSDEPSLWRAAHTAAWGSPTPLGEARIEGEGWRMAFARTYCALRGAEERGEAAVAAASMRLLFKRGLPEGGLRASPIDDGEWRACAYAEILRALKRADFATIAILTTREEDDGGKGEGEGKRRQRRRRLDVRADVERLMLDERQWWRLLAYAREATAAAIESNSTACLSLVREWFWVPRGRPLSSFRASPRWEGPPGKHAWLEPDPRKAPPRRWIDALGYAAAVGADAVAWHLVDELGFDPRDSGRKSRAWGVSLPHLAVIGELTPSRERLIAGMMARWPDCLGWRSCFSPPVARRRSHDRRRCAPYVHPLRVAVLTSKDDAMPIPRLLARLAGERFAHIAERSLDPKEIDHDALVWLEEELLGGSYSGSQRFVDRVRRARRLRFREMFEC
jgi:hypothetical protein